MTTTWTPLLDRDVDRAAKTAPPCAAQPDNWDLDVGTPETWRAAVATCRGCPLLGECAELASVLAARGQAPRAMIWAGVGYDNSGNVIACLDRHRVLPVDVARPSVIIRTSRAALGVVDGAVARTSIPEVPPGRTIVLRRGHRRPVAAGE